MILEFYALCLLVNDFGDHVTHSQSVTVYYYLATESDTSYARSTDIYSDFPPRLDITVADDRLDIQWYDYEMRCMYMK